MTFFNGVASLGTVSGEAQLKNHLVIRFERYQETPLSYRILLSGLIEEGLVWKLIKVLSCTVQMPTILVNSQTNKDWQGVAIMAMEPIMVIWRCCWWRWNAEWWEDPVPRPTALEGLSEVGQLDTLPPYRQPLYSLLPLPSPSIQITNILLHHFKWHLHLQELSGWWMNTRPACRQPILNPQSSPHPFFRSFFRIFTFQPLHLNFEHQNSS